MGSSAVGPNSPVTGLLRFNQTRNRPELYYNNKWRPLAANGDIEYPQKDIFYGTGRETVFGPMKFSYPTGNEIFLLVFIHNVFQNPGAAYIVDNFTINFTSPPPNGHPIVILHGAVFGDYSESLLTYVPPTGGISPASTSHWSLSEVGPQPARENTFIGFEIGLTTAGQLATLVYPQYLHLRMTAVTGNLTVQDFGNLETMYGSQVSYTVQSNTLTANLSFPPNTTTESFFLDIAQDMFVEGDETFEVNVFIDNTYINSIGNLIVTVRDS